MCVALFCAFFEKAVKHLPRVNVLEVLQILIQSRLENSLLLRCPKGVNNSHAIRPAGLTSEKFVGILLINYTKKITNRNKTSITYAHKPSKKHFRL